MYKYIRKRIIQLIIILLGITFITFLLLYISPGDPAYIKLSSAGTPPSKELISITRENMGLNRPFFVQYFSWVKNVVMGDFGKSYDTGIPVKKLFMDYLPSTFQLTICGFLIALIISFPIGIFSALYKNKLFDRVSRFISILFISIPDFYLALILIYVFCIKLRWLPLVNTKGLNGLILPSLTLGIITSGILISQIRVAVLEELKQDYVRGAEARGLSTWIIVVKHILKNSMIGIVTILGIKFGYLIGGTAIVEVLFIRKGVSSLVVNAIANRDIPTIQIYTLWMSFSFSIINFFVDISYRYLDPRIRIKMEKHSNDKQI